MTDIQRLSVNPIAYGRAGARVFLTLYQALVKRNNKTHSYFFVGRGDTIEEEKKPDAVVCICLIDDKILCTSEYRIPIGTRELGFPAGLIDEADWLEANGDYAKAAKRAAVREVLEETDGWYDYEPVMVSPNNLWSSPGMTNESVVYVLGFATKRREQSKERRESIEDIVIMPLNDEELRDVLDTPDSEKDHTFGKTAWPFLWTMSQFGLKEFTEKLRRT